MLQFDLQFYEELTVAWVKTVKFISRAFFLPTGQLVFLHIMQDTESHCRLAQSCVSALLSQNINKIYAHKCKWCARKWEHGYIGYVTTAFDKLFSFSYVHMRYPKMQMICTLQGYVRFITTQYCILFPCWRSSFIKYTEILEVNFFAFAYRLFHEDFSPLQGAFIK